MESFGNSSLFCNFNDQPRKLDSPKSPQRRSSSKQSPRSSPRNSPKTSPKKSNLSPVNRTPPTSSASPRNVSSPDPTVKSMVLDDELSDIEIVLGLREEEFLIELKQFYKSVDEYNRLKEEYEYLLNNRKKGDFSIIQLASQLSMFQDMLEQRANAAQQILSEPLDKYKREEKYVLMLEDEIDRLQKNMPKEVTFDDEETIRKMHQELDQIDAENELNREGIRQKQISTDNEMKQVSNDLINMDVREREESRLNDQFLQDQKLLEKTPKIDVEQAIRDEKLRAEYEERQRILRIKEKEFDSTSASLKENANKLQSEVSELESEFQELSTLKKEIDKTSEELQSYVDFKENGATRLSEQEEELARLKRKLELQLIDLEKINKKKEVLERKINDAEKTKAKLLEKDEDLKKRRAILDGSSDHFAAIRAEIEEMKRKVAMLYDEVQKYEKLAKDMMEKCSVAQEELDAKSTAIANGPPSNQMEELQKLLNESETGLTSPRK